MCSSDLVLVPLGNLSIGLKTSLGVPFFSFKRLRLSAAARKRRSRSAAAFDSGLLSLPLFFKGKDSARTCFFRSEERRVGKECRFRVSPYH